LPGGKKRQKPVRDIACPRCGTRAVFAVRKPYCPNCHWNVDNARGALQPTIGGTLWLIIWFAFAIYVVKAPWFFLVLAAGVIGYELFKSFRAWRGLPKMAVDNLEQRGQIAPPARQLEFSTTRKSGDYSYLLLLIPPLFIVIGATMFPWSGFSAYLHQSLNWGQLWDVVLPGFFMVLGCTVGFKLFKQQYATRKVLREPVCVSGVVTKATEDGLRYRFRDLAGLEHEGEGTEYSGDYYEEMDVPVIYERENPKNNLPVSALYDQYEVHFELN